MLCLLPNRTLAMQPAITPGNQGDSRFESTSVGLTGHNANQIVDPG